MIPACSCRVALIAAVLALSACATSGSTTAVDAGPVARSARASDDAADFLTEMIEARRRDYAEGLLALNQATTPALRAYGAEMTRDQTELLTELTRLAATLRVDVAPAAGVDGSPPLRSLGALQGRDFDLRFMSMIAADHRQAIRAMDAAQNLERDPLVADFARRRRPLIQSRLDEIEAIRAAY